MIFKYKLHLEGFDDCPPLSKVSPLEGVSYRFVYHVISDPKNFLPPASKPPERGFVQRDACCGSHALSMFTTKAKACKWYKEKKGLWRHIGVTIGTHLAEGAVAPPDGVATAPSKSGHFDFFEFDICDFSKKFAIIEDVHNA